LGDAKIPLKIALGPAVQDVLSGIILNEFLFGPEGFGPGNWVTKVIFLPFLSVSWFLSLFFIWKIFLVAEQEAKITAREKLVADLQRQTEAIRTQRHDFINHFQVMVALLQDSQKEAFARYVAGIKENLGGNS